MPSKRYEFSKQVKRDALKRSGGRCEAAGEVYGLEPGVRCFVAFKKGTQEFDHYPVPATVEGSNTFENCVVCCPDHHSFKTRTLDIPVQAKTKRVSDKHLGIRPKTKWQSPGFPKREKQRTATRKIRKG